MVGEEEGDRGDPATIRCSDPICWVINITKQGQIIYQIYQIYQIKINLLF